MPGRGWADQGWRTAGGSPRTNAVEIHSLVSAVTGSPEAQECAALGPIRLQDLRS